MKMRNISQKLEWLLLAVLLAACATVPYTRRSQLVLVSQAQEMELGVAAYREALKKEKVLASGPQVEVVRRVGEHIAHAANRPDFRWEFNVIEDDKMANAFALPGGKVAVYTGIFPVARDEAGLAAVIGHEVAHAIARHGAERMSQGLLAEIGALGLGVAMGDASPATKHAIMAAFGLGTQVGVLLPFSRAQESEADRIGLILMAKAGYEPEAALHLWQRMEGVAEQRKEWAPPEFLSTHPSYGRRQENIRTWLAEARQHRAANPIAGTALLPGVKPAAIAGDEPR